MVKVQNKLIITVQDWDDAVTNTYGRPYSFQQQDGCKDRGTFYLNVPETADDFDDDENSDEMGVSFATWLARDPKEKLPNQVYDWELSMWWERNFYPNFQMIANDLHQKGLLPAGKYGIEIDW